MSWTNTAICHTFGPNTIFRRLLVLEKKVVIWLSCFVACLWRNNHLDKTAMVKHNSQGLEELSNTLGTFLARLMKQQQPACLQQK